MKSQIQDIVLRYPLDTQFVKELMIVVDEYEQKMAWSISWSPEDMQMRAREDGWELDEDDAVEALNNMIDNHDCNYGITWMHVDEAIQQYEEGSQLIEDDEWKETSTNELFHCCINNHLIAPDEKWDDWKMERKRLTEILDKSAEQ